MKATYDKEADAMYIRVKKGRVKKTLELSDSLLVDIDARGTVLGIEMLDVSSKIPTRRISQTFAKKGIPVSLAPRTVLTRID